MSAVNVLSGEVASSPQAAGTTRRRLVVAWQHPTERSICPVGILSFDGSRYRFHYIANVRSEADFRPFLGFPDFAATYESDHLFPLFSQRAMAPRRPDYRRWVTRLGLDDDATPWEQIARSGGRREGDTIQLFPVPRIDEGLLACSFLVHGIRHIPESSLTYGQENHTISRDELEEELSRLHPGDRLLLADEPHNPFNPRAILTTTAADFPLGWVPDLLVEDLHRVGERSSIDVRVQQVNDPEAGWHLRLLVQLTAPVPEGFEVFQGDHWAPYDDSN
jgi:hypothetical protein